MRPVGVATVARVQQYSCAGTKTPNYGANEPYWVF